MRDPESNAELAAALRAWQGKMTSYQAADLLGIPKRTYDNILAGRGFGYPRLIYLALEVLSKNEPSK